MMVEKGISGERLQSYGEKVGHFLKILVCSFYVDMKASMG